MIRRQIECMMIGIGVALAVLVGPVAAARREDDAWVGRIRKDHPRLFFNADTWPAVKKRALTVERGHYKKVKAHADGARPGMWLFRKAPAPRPGSSVKGGDWGHRLMSAAFVYRIEPAPNRLKRIRDMLWASLDYYHACYAAKTAVDWYSTSRVSWLAALDWVWNDLDPEERRGLGVSMMRHMAEVMNRKVKIRRRNIGGHTSGYYGARNAQWFTGLLFFNEGIDDQKALGFLNKGHEDYQNLLAYRSKGAGDDGGAASSTVTYSFDAYPWSAWNFLHTWQSAIGEDIAGKWPNVGISANYVLWNRLPGNFEYGYGDTAHRHNRFPSTWIYSHMSHVAHFYAKSHPDLAALAAYARRQFGGRHSASYWSVYPFLMINLEKAPKPLDPGKLPPARHFEKMGQVFMRSGPGPDDTYAMFMCGPEMTAHSHCDQNHFIIYKKGHVALDSGTRYPTTVTKHCNSYYRQTVAHNCVLINMPGEDKKRRVGYGHPFPLGGQCVNAGKIAAFETGPHFTYVAGDATEAYDKAKCKMAVRQFVFIPPDHFVVFDRITSTKPEYEKTWLLHTAREPVMDGKQFRADRDRGRLFCRTLFPEDAVLKKVGGPGSQFLAGGVDYPLESKWYNEDGTLKHELMGEWRVEISPGAPRAEDAFLHLIQVGGAQGLQTMSPHKLIKDANALGVRFTASGGRQVEVRFAVSGPPAGHIKITRGRARTNRTFTMQVQPQVGLSGAPTAPRPARRP